MIDHYRYANLGTRTSVNGERSRVFKFTADPYFVYHVDFIEREHDFVEVTFYLAKDSRSSDLIKFGRLVGVSNPLKVLNKVGSKVYLVVLREVYLEELMQQVKEGTF